MHDWPQVLNSYQTQYAVDSTPGLLEFLSFEFGLGNLLAGPYLEYVDYRDFIELKGVSVSYKAVTTLKRTHAHTFPQPNFPTYSLILG